MRGTAVGRIWTLLNAITAIATGSATLTHPAGPKTVQAVISGTGAINATINVYGSHYNDTTKGVLLGTLAPNGTTMAVDALSIAAPWPYLWGDLTAVSGSTTVTVTAAG